MKDQGRLPTLIWILTVVLVLVFMGLQIIDTGEKTFPSASSYLPSGTHAFSVLLERLGYKVDVSRSSNPDLKPDDIAVVYSVWHSGSMFSAQPRPAIEQKLNGYGAKKALVLYVESNFQSNSKRAAETTSVNAQVASMPIDVSIGNNYRFKRASSDMWSIDEDSQEVSEGRDITLFFARSEYFPFVVRSKTKTKEYLHVGDGLGTTNRFLDKADNAAFFSGLVRYLGPKGSHVVFLEDAISNGEKPTVLGTLAPWSGPSRLQAILLIAFTIWMLGKRFGLPDERRLDQRGSKELADAVADTSMRARASEFALSTILDDCERQIRKALKVGSDVSRENLLFQLPPDTAACFAKAIAGLKEKVPDGEALKLIRQVQTATDELVGRHHRPLRKRRMKN